MRLALVGLVACGPTVSPLHGTAAHDGPPALAAKLFGAKTELQLPYDVRFAEDATTRHGTASCWVTPAEVPHGWAASIDCGSRTDDDGGVIADSLFGKLIATDAGLWWTGAVPADAASLDPADMKLAAAPHAWTRRIPPHDGDPRTIARTVVAFEGGWCAVDEERLVVVPPDDPQACVTMTRSFCFRHGTLLGAALDACSVAYRVGRAPAKLP